MRIGTFDLDDDVLVVAEIGNNHEGDMGRAREMVHAAADSGATAVKLQTFRTEHYVSALDEARFAQLKGFELTFDQFAELAELTRSLGRLFVCTPFDLESAAFLEEVVDAMKIASGDVDFVPLVRRVAEGARPMIVSSGISDLARLRAAVDTIESVRGRPADPELALLHCVSAYPAAPADLNLRAISVLREAFPYTIGFSDHSIGTDAAVAAVALGARIVEKHFTLEGIESDFRDHELSLTPPQMRELVERVGLANRMLGEREKQVQEAERGVVRAMTRSVAAARPLAAGEELQDGDVTWVRPGGGLPPGEEGSVLGRRLRRDLRQGEQISVADVE